MAARKAIFVTGGGSGIGRAIAVRFAGEGWFVGLGDCNAAGMAETAALLPAGQSCSHIFDVSDRQAWDEALRAVAEAAGGRIDNRKRNSQIRDVVVATGLEFTPVEEVAEAAWWAVTSETMHHLVGKSARRMRLLAKWAPGLLRKRARLIAEAHERVAR